jgi:hypothetical protein
MTALAATMFTAVTVRAASEYANLAPVDAAVRATLQVLDYQPGDILTDEHVKKILKMLAKAGYGVPDPLAIRSRVVPNDSPLRQQFDSSRGRRFLRKIGQIPGGLERMERLAQMPQGEQLMRQLQRDPGGEKMIEYLATTASGRRLGAMTADGPHGVNLNEPTGRIYTESDLLKAIHHALAEEAESTGDRAAPTPAP